MTKQLVRTPLMSLLDLLLQAGDDAVWAGLGFTLLIIIALALAVVVLGIMVVVQAYKAGRQGWWVYLIALFIGPLNLIAIILWFAVWKKDPLMVNGKPFL